MIDPFLSFKEIQLINDIIKDITAIKYAMLLYG
ncbi:hypothetical protein SAMN05421640_3290 [Ekhidna lutea]|uniref:Uncharacterized protein n=1 Tax=Ekhidna lutea TaxID=447679 RepID=A0A239LIA9_EKHLU|nr:hypothetical protein SAMN05421640_3290 [Ekhidna lutea]